MGGCCSAPREVSGDGFSQADQAKRVDLCARSLALNDGRLIVYGEFPTHRAPRGPDIIARDQLAKRNRAR